MPDQRKSHPPRRFLRHFSEWNESVWQRLFGVQAMIGNAILIIGFLVYFVICLFKHQPIPLWNGMALSFFTILFIVLSFMSFQSACDQRDEAKEQLDQANKKQSGLLPNVTQKNGVIVPEKRLIIEVHDSDFGVSGDQGYPLLDSGKGKARWLRLGITFHSEGSGAYIETLELVISGRTPIQAFRCKPGLAGGGYYEYFQIPDWVKSGEHTIRVQAFANGTTWGSPEQIVNFPA